MTISTVADCYEPIRALLGDFHATVRKYQDSAIASVVRTQLLFGQVPGHTLAADRSTITPSITAPRLFALLCYQSVKTFVLPNAAPYGYATRAIRESFGEQRHFLFELENALYDLTNPVAFASWTSFSSWVLSITGVRLWASLSDVTVDAPVRSVSVGAAGITLSQTAPEAAEAPVVTPAADLPYVLTVPLDVGVTGGTVVYAQTFGHVPVVASLNVIAPDGGEGLFAAVIGEPTATGFTFVLQGSPTAGGGVRAVPSAGYQLTYYLV